MARVRIENEPVLKSWDDVNITLKEIGELELAKEKIEADMNQKISDLKLEAEFAAKPIIERMGKLANDIKEFVELHRADIKGKTMVLNFGKTGFRKSTKIIIKSVKTVIANLKARKMTDCINTKESVNKERLGEYPDEIIAAVGAGKKVEDVFWYEVDREKLLG
ncbi:MAG: host-nuclease inhibitor Gam family protein [Peptococcaceae bacterium]|jgi:phage host-nuclease inhibitor protein Gam|nr:host-nuclease inhibitor Gam family protein [Peptococcaceae bacterium]MDH7526022.1 host-nuclease inhibitor Gam family protein [Peptococcaceae bacterium]